MMSLDAEYMPGQRDMTMAEVRKYRDRRKIGEKVTVYITEANQDESKFSSAKVKKVKAARILSLYPHICITDFGVFRWIDLAIWNGIHSENWIKYNIKGRRTE